VKRCSFDVELTGEVLSIDEDNLLFVEEKRGVVHSLDYDMMSQVLQQFNYSGEARADIPSQAVMKGGGRVTLAVKDGRILSCFILDKHGQKLSHDQEAYRLLARLGILEWELVPLSSPTSPATPAPTPQTNQPPRTQPSVQTNRVYRSAFPRHLHVSQAQMRSWSMLQRSVYMLCDGTRSSEQLAALLSRPHDLIEQTLNDLRLLGAIEG
jgi:hypothetical protein